MVSKAMIMTVTLYQTCTTTLMSGWNHSRRRSTGSSQEKIRDAVVDWHHRYTRSARWCSEEQEHWLVAGEAVCQWWQKELNIASGSMRDKHCFGEQEMQCTGSEMRGGHH